MNIHVIHGNKEAKIEGRVGEPLTAALLRARFFVSEPCGGKGTCGKCKVICYKGTEPCGEIAPAEKPEVLACQTFLDDCDYIVELPTAFEQTHTTFQIDKIEQPQNPQNGLGLAVDIGTTTIEVLLADLETGEIKGYTSCLNPQKAYGADVISRIAACGKDGALQDMQRLVIESISDETKRLLKDKKAERMVIAGNTTMLHLFKGVDPTPLGRAPFTPVFTESVAINAEDVFASIPVKEIVLLPSVSAYIGADITADVVDLNLPKEQNALMVDLGTNGEMVLKKGTYFYCTSTAAGPALEGANIECGIGGVAGAISAVTNIDIPSYETIGQQAPIGICGSGLVDLVAILLDDAKIDENGLMEEERFYLTDKVYLSQKDVRQMQLAKSAIRTGLEMLLEEAKLPTGQIDAFYVLGGLGTHLNAYSAQRVGFFPKELVAKLKDGGNGSLKGAYRVLINPERIKEAQAFTQCAKVTELAHNPKFNDLFTDNLFFEEE